jgi:integrase
MPNGPRVRKDRCIFYYPSLNKGTEKHPKGNCFVVIIERKGQPVQMRSFPSLKEARIFRDDEQGAIRNTSKFTVATQLKGRLADHVIADYIEELKRRQARYHLYAVEGQENVVRYSNSLVNLNTFREKHKQFCNKHVLNITPLDVENLINERIATPWRGPQGNWEQERYPVKSTIQRQITPLRAAFKWITKKYPSCPNPFEKIDWEVIITPKRAKDRKPRPLMKGELDRLLKSCEDCQGINKVRMPLAILMAVETGMRKGEMLRLRWKDIDNETRTIHIYRTKTDHTKDEEDRGRTTPLTYIVFRALQMLQCKTGDQGKVFGDWTEVGLNNAWHEVRLRAGVKGFGWHHFRHEAISRFNTFLTPEELRLVVGHSNDEEDGHTRITRGYIHHDRDIYKRIGDKINAYSVGSLKEDGSLNLDWGPASDKWEVRQGVNGRDLLDMPFHEYIHRMIGEYKPQVIAGT